MDWKALLQDLRAAGWTQVQIAARVGVWQSVISELSNGNTKSPRYEVGAALVALRDEVRAST